MEQQTDSQVNTGRADAEAVRQSHGGAKRRRGGRAKLDTDFEKETLAALRTRAKRLGLAPSTWVRTVVRDALHASRSEELDAAVAAHLLGVEARVQASADARELTAQIRPLAINVNGGRLLRRWLSFPLIDLEEIHRRQRIVATLVRDSELRRSLGECFTGKIGRAHV